MNNSKQHKATLLGFGAIIMWGMLALLTSFCGNIPPFQLAAMTFFIAFLIGVVAFIRSERNYSRLKQPISVWIIGVLGLFGYHAIYFMAMKNAPSIEVSLINYLWPVLIVVFSSFLPGEKLRWFHLLGVALGFLGIVLLLQSNGSFHLNQKYILGYGQALSCAIIWSLYSVLSRKNQGAPTLLIGAFCGITSILSLICHLLFEKTVMPGMIEWIPIVLLGLGPVGLAFFVWDYGVKNGNIKLLGTLSYIAPLLSSILLICFGRTEFSWILMVSCALIIGGSAVSSFDNIRGIQSRQ
ncbi:MAG: DMT family transporter [Chitinophagales bacterium]